MSDNQCYINFCKHGGNLSFCLAYKKFGIKVDPGLILREDIASSLQVCFHPSIFWTVNPTQGHGGA